jgi:nitrile hydratase subunit beta
MNGAQDLGGQMGFGPVVPEPDEPAFHAEWEKLALAVTLACGAMGHWSIDATRHARETLHPVVYLTSSYYEIWIKALQKLLQAEGFVSEDELQSGRALAVTRTPNRVLRAAEVAAALARGSPSERPLAQPARFAVGDRVRTVNDHPAGHTRVPRYARGRVGRIERVHGAHVFPNTNAHGRGENPQWLYTVAFDGRELWGRDADPNLLVSIDAWESTLEPAGPPQGRDPERAARRKADRPAGPPQGRDPERAARRKADRPAGPPQGRDPERSGKEVQ